MPFPRPGPRCSSVAAGLVGHAAVAVGRAGRDAFEQREHRAHLGHVVERGDELHLRGARVGEADVDAVGDERADQGVRAVHVLPAQSSVYSRVRGSVEQGARVQDALRVERDLDATHQRDLGRVLELEEVLLLLLADAVLGRDRAAELRCRPRGSRASPCAAPPRRPGTPTGARCRRPRARRRATHVACSSAMPATVARYSGTDARGTTTSMMSLAPFCFATQNAFSRASSSSAAERGGSTYTSSAPSSREQLGDRDRVVVDPVGVVLLDDDDQVRRRSRPARPAGCRGRARRSRWSRPCSSASMYSRISGFTPLLHDARHRGRHLVERAERREHRRGVRRDADRASGSPRSRSRACLRNR